MYIQHFVLINHSIDMLQKAIVKYYNGEKFCETVIRGEIKQLSICV